jgi:hypothetical protein
MPRGNYQKKVPTQFAAPRHNVWRDTEKRKQAIGGFEYWREIGGTIDAPSELADFIEVNVYRTWPVCDLKRLDPPPKRITWDILEGPCPFEPEAYKEFFLEKYGSGEWKLILNEKGVQGEVILIYFSAVDLDRYPPKLDLKTVVPGVFANQSYIRWLRDRGTLLPWEDGNEEREQQQREDEEMGTVAAEALRSITEAHERMVDKNLELSEKLSEARNTQAPAAPAPDAEAHATNRAIDLVASSAERMINMVSEKAGSQYDPVEMLRTTAEVLRGGEDKNSGAESARIMADSFKETVAKMAEMQEKHLEFLKTVVMQKNADGTWSARAVEQEKPKTLIEQLNEYRTIGEMLGWTPGREMVPASAAAEEAPAREQKSSSWLTPETIVPITGLITMAFTLGANMLHNWAVARAGQGKPEDPQEAIKKAAANTAGAMPGGMPGAAAQPQQQPQDPRAMWAQFIDQQLKVPFLAHFYDPQCNGYTLAQFLQSDGTMGTPTANGRHVYMTLVEQVKREGMDLLIRGNHDIWSKVQGLPQKYDQYLDEFFGYDEWAMEQQGGSAQHTAAN